MIVFEPNWEDQIKRQIGVRNLLENTADDVAALAEMIAPRGTEQYVRSVSADGARVQTEDPFGHLVEWGSVNNVAYAPLRRAAEASGLDVDEDPKP